MTPTHDLTPVYVAWERVDHAGDWVRVLTAATEADAWRNLLSRPWAGKTREVRVSLEERQP